MGYGDEKVIVDVKDLERGELLYTDREGKQTTYYPSHGIWLEIQTLEVLTVLDVTNQGEPPSLSTKVRGVAVLEDRSISVVGDPGSRARTLTITFSPGEWKPEPVKPRQDDFPSFSNELGGAMLGFNRADWEIGNDDDWWIACYLPERFVSALAADVRGGQLSSLKLNLSLRRLYTSTHSWEPVSSRGDLFIRPDSRDNSLTFPETAPGYVRAIHFTSSPRDLRKPETEAAAERVVQDDDAQSASPPPAADPVAVATLALAERIEQTRKTLKWIGGFIVVALLLVAAK